MLAQSQLTLLLLTVYLQKGPRSVRISPTGRSGLVYVLHALCTATPRTLPPAVQLATSLSSKHTPVMAAAAEYCACAHVLVSFLPRQIPTRERVSARPLKQNIANWPRPISRSKPLCDGRFARFPLSFHTSKLRNRHLLTFSCVPFHLLSFKTSLRANFKTKVAR